MNKREFIFSLTVLAITQAEVENGRTIGPQVVAQIADEKFVIPTEGDVYELAEAYTEYEYDNTNILSKPSWLVDFYA